jgi:pilus assembly protein Flp/PilA
MAPRLLYLRHIQSTAGTLKYTENDDMQAKLMNLYFTAQEVLQREEGQDLIEYALVVALIAFAATVGMGTLATGINNAFETIATKLQTAVA